jgi:hypothetical protein
MEFKLGRPSKPFVVEVKRGRRGAVSAFPSAMPKPTETAASAVAERSFGPPPEPPKPQRRILDAIEPAPAPLLEPVVAVAVDPLKRRRGRPPKAVSVPALDGERSQERPMVKRRVEAPVVPVARREFVKVPETPAAQAAPSREAKRVIRTHVQPDEGRVQHDHLVHDHITHGHMTHGDRAEAAISLPRGERWKRRLPKVLW